MHPIYTYMHPHAPHINTHINTHQYPHTHTPFMMKSHRNKNNSIKKSKFNFLGEITYDFAFKFKNSSLQPPSFFPEQKNTAPTPTLRSSFFKSWNSNLVFSKDAHSFNVIGPSPFNFRINDKIKKVVCLDNGLVLSSGNALYYADSKKLNFLDGCCVDVERHRDSLLILEKDRIKVWRGNAMEEVLFRVKDDSLNLIVGGDHPRVVSVFGSNSGYMVDLRSKHSLCKILSSADKIRRVVKCGEDMVVQGSTSLSRIVGYSEVSMSVEFGSDEFNSGRYRMEVGDRIVIYNLKGNFLFFEKDNLLECASRVYDIKGFLGFTCCDDKSFFMTDECIYTFAGGRKYEMKYKVRNMERMGVEKGGYGGFFSGNNYGFFEGLYGVRSSVECDDDVAYGLYDEIDGLIESSVRKEVVETENAGNIGWKKYVDRKEECGF